MISKNEYVKMTEAVADFDNAIVMAAEALGVCSIEGAHTSFIDAVLSMLIAETNDCGIGDLPDVEVWDCPRHFLENDMPLLFFWCWDLNFGDGDCNGNIPTIVVEDVEYYLSDAETLWLCVNHLHQLRCHYGVDTSAIFDASM